MRSRTSFGLRQIFRLKLLPFGARFIDSEGAISAPTDTRHSALFQWVKTAKHP